MLNTWRTIILFAGLMLLSSSVTASDTGPRLVVTGDSAAPPFCYIDEEGNPAGFNVDIFNAIAEITGLSAKITLAPWMEAMSMVEDGRADVFLGMYVSGRRSKLFDFSYPFITGMHLLYVRRGVDIEDMNDLAGKTVIVSRGDIMHDYVMEHDTGATIIFEKSHKECLRMLAEGGCDCYLSVLPLGYPYDLGYDHDKITAVGDPSVPLDYCFAVKKGDAELTAQINEGLAAINENGAFSDIYGKWFQEVKPHIIRVVAKYVVIVLAPIIILMAMLGIWIWTLC
ncbi:MAG: transporter substrate-binding domain-containing protein, partial [Candidatus Latescibacteria bacterium]|nr:transporter substrate-binding domain-containing protein [Candidatus Latescibacterota bacterium]